VRHKCIDCPDWDYCGDCVKLALSEHAGHRFAPIYEALSEPPRFAYSTVHEGICCDGPLCTSNPNATYISGVRYECAVCPDTDFCGCCEAHPSNPHNKTHPLIKFKTAVRHALVSTMGYEDNGSEMPTMGDGYDFRRPVAKAPEPTMSSPRPVVSVEPSEPRVAMKKEDVKKTIKLLKQRIAVELD
jgi:next-to-BRCA1 protein 1